MCKLGRCDRTEEWLQLVVYKYEVQLVYLGVNWREEWLQRVSYKHEVQLVV